MGIFKFTKQSWRVVMVMALLAIGAILFAWIYYSDINQSEDPRVVEVKHMYLRYNEFQRESDYHKMLEVLDSIYDMYSNQDHYKASYEMGVVLNNIAAIYLNSAVHLISDSIEKHSTLEKARNHLEQGMKIYQIWQSEFLGLSSFEIEQKIESDFEADKLGVSPKRASKILQKRVSDIEDAQFEIDRRLSVSYTNLGIVNRHKKQYQKAIDNYQQAIELWSENLTALNNMNILLGRPQEKETIIRKLFPPDRKKQSE